MALSKAIFEPMGEKVWGGESGSAGAATAATIVIEDDHNNALNIEVYRTSGLARVEPGAPREAPKQRTLYYGKGKKKK